MTGRQLVEVTFDSFTNTMGLVWEYQQRRTVWVRTINGQGLVPILGPVETRREVQEVVDPTAADLHAAHALLLPTHYPLQRAEDFIHHDKYQSGSLTILIEHHRRECERRVADLTITALPDHRTDLDDAVRLRRLDTQHKFESVTVDGVTFQACERCGRRQDQVKLDDGTMLPCRGFI